MIWDYYTVMDSILLYIQNNFFLIIWFAHSELLYSKSNQDGLIKSESEIYIKYSWIRASRLYLYIVSIWIADGRAIFIHPATTAIPI